MSAIKKFLSSRPTSEFLNYQIFGAATPILRQVEFKVWGAGGGGGAGQGGGGAYVTATYRFDEPTNLRIVIGQGGASNPSLNVGRYGGGGHKGTTYGYNVGSGGGLSGVFVTNDSIYGGTYGDLPQSGATIDNALLVAAAGGGSGWTSGTAGQGGHGGFTTGATGGSPGGSTAGTGGVWNGFGTNAGAVGTNNQGNGFIFRGGFTSGGGGGGSGAWGGAGGNNGSTVSSGGGGASYIKTTQTMPLESISYVTGANGISGSTINAANANDAQNNNTSGQGGSINNQGQNGIVAYRLNVGTWEYFTYTGADQSLFLS